jgi:hypothetical protein
MGAAHIAKVFSLLQWLLGILWCWIPVFFYLTDKGYWTLLLTLGLPLATIPTVCVSFIVVGVASKRPQIILTVR